MNIFGEEEHEFEKSLQKEREDIKDTNIDIIFNHFYPGCHIKHLKTGSLGQRKGIDFYIIHEGEAIGIDMKLRKGYTYPDILLEHISVDYNRKPGWCTRYSGKICDIFAYKKPNWEVWLLPRTALWNAWDEYGEIWLEKYGCNHSPNKGYNTLNCPVPDRIIRSTLAGVRIANLNGLIQ